MLQICNIQTSRVKGIGSEVNDLTTEGHANLMTHCDKCNIHDWYKKIITEAIQLHVHILSNVKSSAQ